jgi:hypothetical protein
MLTIVHDVAAKAPDPKTLEEKLVVLIKKKGHGRSPVSNPEAFDIIEGNCQISTWRAPTLTIKQELQRRVVELVGNMKAGRPHRSLVSWAQINRVPVLTTNYDHCLQDAAYDPPVRRYIFKTRKVRSAYYPWDRYYASKPVDDPLKEFAIWHIHGDREFKPSIRAGLDQYMGMVQRLRKLKYPISREMFVGSDSDTHANPAYHAAPWLRIFFGQSLWIQGLELSGGEVGLRWLLIQRFIYWMRFRPKEAHRSGWYVQRITGRDKTLNYERRVFLESVGIQILEIDPSIESYEGAFASY